MNDLPPLRYLERIIVDDTGWNAVRGTIGEVTYERVVKFDRELLDEELRDATGWVQADICFNEPSHPWPKVKVTKAVEKTAAWLFEITMDTSRQA